MLATLMRYRGHDERIRLAAIATSEQDEDDLIAVWSGRDLPDALGGDSIEITAS